MLNEIKGRRREEMEEQEEGRGQKRSPERDYPYNIDRRDGQMERGGDGKKDKQSGNSRKLARPHLC